MNNSFYIGLIDNPFINHNAVSNEINNYLSQLSINNKFKKKILKYSKLGYKNFECSYKNVIIETAKITAY